MGTTSGIFGAIPQVDASAGKFVNTTQDADKLRMDFLKLLTAQLQYQDPLEPEKNSDFTAQMAQFSSLGEQQKSNELLTKLLTTQNVSQMNNAVSYIGKVAVVAGNNVVMTGGKGNVRFDMPAAGGATINLFDQSGRLVQSLTGQAFSQGEQSYSINASDLPDGNYAFSVTTTDADGNQVAVPTLESGVVKAVVNGTDGVTIEVNGRRVNLADVRQVEQASVN
ncbi:MAG: hypothetical protein HQM03_15645 [Magnetococcales bacterium]|nr:hypothetical protein [Magnetococcales bacterium]